LPLVGPEWWVARRISYVLGAPIPDHVQELMHRGRLAHGGAAQELLGFTPAAPASEVIDRLFKWESVVRLPPIEQGVA
jgi:hypothetical protein